MATMAGAILGASHSDERPRHELLDQDYLVEEALRLEALGRGEVVGHHSYPDLLRWEAPLSQADALVADDAGSPLVEGLGMVADAGSTVWTPREDFGWQWVKLGFGQTLLIKRRAQLRLLRDSNELAPPPAPPTAARNRQQRTQTAKSHPNAVPKDRGVNLDSAIEHARQHIQDNAELGYTVRRVARDGTVTDLVALVTSLRDQLRN